VPTPDEIRLKLAELLGRIANVPSDSVRDTAGLKDLGIDSVATVELAEGVATGFGIRLDDESVNVWRTVGDVVRSVQRGSAPVAATDNDNDNAGFLASLPPPQLTDPEKIGAFKQLAVVFALIGAGLGVVIGVGAAALLASSGLGGSSLPPIGAPVGPTPVASQTPTPDGGSNRFTEPPFRGGDDEPPASASPTPSGAALTATPGTVSTGERFSLAGRLPSAHVGDTLIVEWRESGGAWASFPISVTARDDGSFESQVYISSPGDREFRVRSEAGGGITPPATVHIN
jgi:acyl carrier protein